MENLIYWDTTKQCKCTAKHHITDEVQYGDPPNQHSLASKFLIEITRGSPYVMHTTPIFYWTNHATLPNWISHSLMITLKYFLTAHFQQPLPQPKPTLKDKVQNYSHVNFNN